MVEHATQQADRPLELDRYGLDELGDADRFAHQHDGRLIYSKQLGAWFLWDDVRWRPCETDDEWRAARATIDRFRAWTNSLPKGEDKDKAKAHLRKMRGKVSMGNMISLARSDPKISRSSSQLDRDDLLLTCKNKTLHLGRLARGEVGGVMEHNPSDLITNLAPVVYDEDARAPLWEEKVGEISDGDVGWIDFLQRAAGYSLTGLVHEQKCFFCQGEGANGKSVVITVLRETMGTYSGEAPGNVLLDGDRHSTELTDFRGKRLMWCMETGKGQTLDEAKLKVLSSNDPIKARRMRQDFFTFMPTHKLWMMTNNLPRIRAQDHGTWRRPLVIPFLITFSDAQQDKQLTAKLRKEYSGILNWRIEGLRRYYEIGLEPSLAVVQAGAEYRNEQDVLGFFVRAKLEEGEGEKIRASRCFELYEQWCKENRIQERFRWNMMKFGTEIKARKGIHESRDSEGIIYKGVGEK